MAQTATSWEGQTLEHGRYRIVAKLGEGGMGVVYRARDEKLSCEVVIKVPHFFMIQQGDFATRFAREIRSLVQLSHPYIVKIQDVGEHDGLPFAVMQYLAGGSLEDHKRIDMRGIACPVDPALLADWLPNVAKALDFVHQRGYVHRDIKPENILFDQEGNVYLSDFGVAKALSDSAMEAHTRNLTATGMVLGTVNYMAPEVIQGENYDGRSDQYSLAVTVYELLSGCPPFAAPTPAAVIVAKATKRAPSLFKVGGHLPAPLCEAVDRALLMAAAERFSTCSEFADAVTSGLRALAPVPSRLSAEPPRASPTEMVRHRCPACGAALKLPPELAGRTASCPKCGSRLHVAGDLSSVSQHLAVPPLPTCRLIGPPPVVTPPSCQDTDATAVVTAELVSRVETPSAIDKAERPGGRIWTQKQQIAMFAFGFLIFAGAAWWFLLPPTVVVAKDGSGDCWSISEAISLADEGGRILIEPGTYNEDGLVLEKRLRIVGNGGPDKVVIYLSKPLEVRCDGVILEKVSVRGTMPVNGISDSLSDSAIYMATGSLTIRNSRITSDSTACIGVNGSGTQLFIRKSELHDSNGPGIWFQQEANGIIDDSIVRGVKVEGIRVVKSTANIRRCKIHDGEGVGISFSDAADGTVEDCDLFKNKMAAIWVRRSSSLTIHGCRIYDGIQTGITVSEQASPTIEKCDIHSNTSSGIYVYQGGKPVIRNCTIRDGHSTGIATSSSGSVLEECIFRDNATGNIVLYGASNSRVVKCEVHGGEKHGITAKSKAHADVDDCVITTSGWNGVAAYDSGTLTLRGCSISHTQQSGAAAWESGVITLNDCEIDDCKLSGVYIKSGSANVLRCTISGCKDSGMTVHADGVVNVEDCDVANNEVSGIWVFGKGEITVTNSRINRNDPFGIFVKKDGDATITGCNLSNNVEGPMDSETGARTIVRGNVEDSAT